MYLIYLIYLMYLIDFVDLVGLIKEYLRSITESKKTYNTYTELFAGLCDAIADSDVGEVKNCLKQIQDVSVLNTTYDDLGRTVIHQAVFSGHCKRLSDTFQVLQLLLKKGVDINALSISQKDSAISGLFRDWFTHRKRLQLLKFLLKNGANPDQHLRHRLLEFELMNGPLSIENKCTALHLVALPCSKSMELLLLLLAYAQNPNAVLRNGGHTPLHVATFHKNPGVVSAFLTHPDINIEYRNHLGHTPLAMAIKMLSQKYKKTNNQNNEKTDNLCKIVKLLKIAGSTLSQEEVQQLTEEAGGYEQIDSLLKEINSTIESVRNTYFFKTKESLNTFRSSKPLTEKSALLLLKWRTTIQFELRHEISPSIFHKEEFFENVGLLKRALKFEYIFYMILNARSFPDSSGLFHTLPQEILDMILEYTLVACSTIQLVKPLRDQIETIPDDIDSSSMPRLSLVG